MNTKETEAPNNKKHPEVDNKSSVQLTAFLQFYSRSEESE